MEIIWNKNPLATVINIDDRDRELMRAKIKYDELWSDVCRIRFLADPKWKRHDPEEAIKQIISIDHRELNDRVDELMEYYESSLHQVHCGDCTCVAASCSKCSAEELLGIDTIAGLGKHEGAKLSGYFSKYAEIDEVLEALNNYRVTPFVENKAWQNGRATEEYYNSHIPRWTREAKNAAEWLRDYKNRHFGGMT